MPGGKQFTMTGSLGDVMKESMNAALTWVRANADRLGIDPEFFRNSDVHIHVPAGAVPKDGPSAGAAMVTALVSLLSGRNVQPRVAMTGETSLSGVILPVGGIKEKVLGAKRAGIQHVILPADNEPNVKEDLQPEMLQGLELIYVRTLDEAIDAAIGKFEPAVREPAPPSTAPVPPVLSEEKPAPKVPTPPSSTFH
jgi:ATP-dependent Lon protease